MGLLRNIFSILFFLFFVGFFLSSASTTFSMSVGDVEREVIRLFRQSELIPQVSVTPAQDNRFIIELTFNIGDRWGRDGFVRNLAKAAITRVFRSDLPLAQGVVKVYFTRIEALHLAVGINHANQISWEESSSPSEFFDKLRSCAQWGKKPEDRTYFIEHRQIIKPSPIISLPPHS